MAKDYYDVLGVKRDASQDDIKRAYRELAMRYHPDRNKSKDAEEEFKRINEAYAVLSDEEKRRQYDAYGPEQFNQRYSTEDIFRNFNFEDIFRNLGINIGGMDVGGSSGDIFDTLFGFSGGRRAADMGSDILAHASITLEEAARGTHKTLMIRHVKKCSRCGGSGAEPGSEIIRCRACGGAGTKKVTRRTPFGVMQTITTCQECGGTGKAFEEACTVCHGHGRVQAEDRVDITIPAGADTGMRLRLRGMGDYGRGRSGDAYVEISVQGNRTFTRRGDDLYIEFHIPFYVAALGGTVTVPTLEGEERLRIEEGAQSGDVIRMRGHGMPRLNSSARGDEVVSITVDTPRNLSAEQRELMKKLAELGGGMDGYTGKKRKFGLF